MDENSLRRNETDSRKSDILKNQRHADRNKITNNQREDYSVSQSRHLLSEWQRHNHNKRQVAE